MYDEQELYAALLSRSRSMPIQRNVDVLEAFDGGQQQSKREPLCTAQRGLLSADHDYLNDPISRK